MYYEEVDENWYNNTILKKRYEMGWCNREYFGYYKEYQAIWNSWNQTLIACPIFPKGVLIQLADDGVQMITKSINIKFDRCKNNTLA